MDPTAENEAEYQNILEVLTRCVDGTRVPYDDTLNLNQRRVRLEEADRGIKLLSDGFGEIILNIKKDRNLYLPINRLVDEVLIDIWAYTDLRDRFSVSQVSSRWRRVALSATNLWTLIDLEYNHAPRLRNLLKRSGSSPLHVVVGIKKPPNWMIRSTGSPANPQSFSFYNLRAPDLYDDYTMAPPFGLTGPTSNLIPFLTQKEFDDNVARCATLDAFVGESKQFYLAPEALVTPMLYLRTLRLMAEVTGYYFGTVPTLSIDSIPAPIFAKETPRLRELYFERIHAQWGDPIYKNLTVLHLSYPNQRATVREIIRILESCPMMTSLELKMCLQDDIFLLANHTPDVESEITIWLSQMKYLHIEDSDGTSMVNLLSSLSLPPLSYLYLAPVDGCFIDAYGRPFKSLMTTIAKTTDLMVTGSYEGYVLQGLNRNIMPQDTSSKSSRWYYTVENPMGKTTIAPWVVPKPITHEDIKGWSATTVTLRIPPNLGPWIQPIHPLISRGDNSTNFIDLLDQASLGGVQFDGVERLDFTDGTFFMDVVYRDIFTRCEGIQKLKFSYNKGIGILTAIVKQELCPMLAEVDLYGIESFPSASSTQLMISPALLADWVENRRENPGIRRLNKVVVQFFDHDYITLDEETRKRIQYGLGDEGSLIWRTTWTPEVAAKRQWVGLAGAEEYPTHYSTMGMEIDPTEASDNPLKREPGYSIESEWPLSIPRPHIGCSAGPW